MADLEIVSILLPTQPSSVLSPDEVIGRDGFVGIVSDKDPRHKNRPVTHMGSQPIIWLDRLKDGTPMAEVSAGFDACVLSEYVSLIEEEPEERQFCFVRDIDEPDVCVNDFPSNSLGLIVRWGQHYQYLNRVVIPNYRRLQSVGHSYGAAWELPIPGDTSQLRVAPLKLMLFRDISRIENGGDVGQSRLDEHGLLHSSIDEQGRSWRDRPSLL